MGFKDVFNKENEDFWGDDEELSNYYTKTYTMDNQIDYSKVRLFVPAGTVKLGLKVKSSMNAPKFGCVAKYRNPPAGERVGKGFDEIPWVTNRKDVFNRIRKRELYFRVAKGVTSIIPDVEFDGALHDSLAGWFYINVLRFQNVTITGIEFSIQVNKSVFDYWMKRTNFDDDGNPERTFPPVGRGPDVSEVTVIRKTQLHPKFLELTLGPREYTKLLYVPDESKDFVSASILPKTDDGLYHINISRRKFLTETEVETIIKEKRGETNPSIAFRDGLVINQRMYITVVNLNKKETKAELYIKPETAN